jgi:hypothetical protein
LGTLSDEAFKTKLGVTPIGIGQTLGGAERFDAP